MEKCLSKSVMYTLQQNFETLVILFITEKNVWLQENKKRWEPGLHFEVELDTVDLRKLNSWNYKKTVSFPMRLSL